jgi:hypothetical protein
MARGTCSSATFADHFAPDGQVRVAEAGCDLGGLLGEAVGPAAQGAVRAQVIQPLGEAVAERDEGAEAAAPPISGHAGYFARPGA